MSIEWWSTHKLPPARNNFCSKVDYACTPPVLSDSPYRPLHLSTSIYPLASIAIQQEAISTQSVINSSWSTSRNNIQGNVDWFVRTGTKHRSKCWMQIFGSTDLLRTRRKKRRRSTPVNIAHIVRFSKYTWRTIWRRSTTLVELGGDISNTSSWMTWA